LEGTLPVTYEVVCLRPEADFLRAEIARILHLPEIKERFVGDGADPVGSTPEEFGRSIRAETEKLAKVAHDAGIKPE
jgi:tripartite-type tricarboxylate transporter receptor subunit TctC